MPKAKLVRAADAAGNVVLGLRLFPVAKGEY